MVRASHTHRCKEGSILAQDSRLAIYGLEEADGKRFLCLELVEGQALAEIGDRKQ